MDATTYHDATKHAFGRFARSLGYLDWATQPNPFRRYPGAAETRLPRPALLPEVPGHPAAPLPLTLATLGSFLRYALGLSAWKAYEQTRWALRVNPSSGNLHPTEAYVVHEGRVEHYTPDAHLLECRAVLGDEAWRLHADGRPGVLIALTSVHWREAWKYGERAFRYCQHDVGHAVGALRYSAALFGWEAVLLPRWTDAQLATLVGLDREGEWGDAEPEFAACVVAVGPAAANGWPLADPGPLTEAARHATWFGKPTQLSPSRVEWPAIDEVARATVWHGSGVPPQDGAPKTADTGVEPSGSDDAAASRVSQDPAANDAARAAAHARIAPDVILHRRSAVAFNPRASLPRAAFDRLLDRVHPPGLPFDAWPWAAQVNLVLFVHRVDGMVPGLYSYVRNPSTRDAWRAAMRSEFLWEPADPSRPLDLLVPTDVSFVANRLSCDQSIASDGYLSLGMIARFAPSLRERGEAEYRRLFWECGLIGQALYLDAEAVGARGTGIGCFFDDAVHEMLGLRGHDWQSLYHFSIGQPVDDTRLMTRPGYDWE